jgi:hypothetical protein
MWIIIYPLFKIFILSWDKETRQLTILFFIISGIGIFFISLYEYAELFNILLIIIVVILLFFTAIPLFAESELVERIGVKKINKDKKWRYLGNDYFGLGLLFFLLGLLFLSMFILNFTMNKAYDIDTILFFIILFSFSIPFFILFHKYFKYQEFVMLIYKEEINKINNILNHITKGYKTIDMVPKYELFLNNYAGRIKIIDSVRDESVNLKYIRPFFEQFSSIYKDNINNDLIDMNILYQKIPITNLTIHLGPINKDNTNLVNVIKNRITKIDLPGRTKYSEMELNKFLKQKVK